MDEYHIYNSSMSDVEVKQIYIDYINKSQMFDSEVNEELLSIVKGYLVYPFFSGTLKNHDYLVVNNNRQINGRMDIKCSYFKGDFLLNKLSSNDFSNEDINIDEINILNREEIEKCESIFINKFIDKAKINICERHNLILTKRGNTLDFSPISKIDEYKRIFYLEEVYELLYHQRGIKKSFKSIYSVLNNCFYEINHINSDLYKEFYKIYRKPIVYIPKEYLKNYYNKSFEIYLKTKKELNFVSSNELFSKLKKNIKFKEYNLYETYLNQLIFYFKKKHLLSELSIPEKDLKEKIFYYYLTLKYNPSSGYELAMLVKDGIINDDYIRLLKQSEALGYVAAKKKLYDYYISSINYDEYHIKKYS